MNDSPEIISVDQRIVDAVRPCTHMAEVMDLRIENARYKTGLELLSKCPYPEVRDTAKAFLEGRVANA